MMVKTLTKSISNVGGKSSLVLYQFPNKFDFQKDNYYIQMMGRIKKGEVEVEPKEKSLGILCNKNIAYFGS